MKNAAEICGRYKNRPDTPRDMGYVRYLKREKGFSEALPYTT